MDTTARHKGDVAVSSGRFGIAPPFRSQHKHSSRSSFVHHGVRRPLQPPLVVVLACMMMMIAVFINSLNSYHPLVNSFSTIVSIPSTQKRPTTNFVIRSNSYSSYIQSGSIPQRLNYPTLLFLSDTDMTENDNNDASSSSAEAKNSAALDDDSATSSATMPTVDRTSFDDAGRSLIDEQDMKRMNEMGDFDVNPNVSRNNLS